MTVCLLPQIEFLKAKYEHNSVEMGDEIGLIGMQVKMERVDKKVFLTQPKNVDRIITVFGVDKVLLLQHFPM